MSEQSADNQGGLRKVWEKTFGRITKKTSGQSKIPHTIETPLVENKANRLTEPIGDFVQLGQRYKDMVNVAIGVDILQIADPQLVINWERYLEENANRKTASTDLPREIKVVKAKVYLLKDYGAQSFRITPEQAEVAANVCADFSDLLKQNPFDYQSLGYDERNSAIVDHMSHLKWLIEHLANLPPDELAELIKQRYEWDINPATIRIKALEVNESGERATLITKDGRDVDYKTAIKNKSDLESVLAHRERSYPEQIHMLKLYEEVFAPYFQRGPGFGPQRGGNS